MEQNSFNETLLAELKKPGTITLDSGLGTELEKIPEFKDFFEKISREMLDSIQTIAEVHVKEAQVDDLLEPKPEKAFKFNEKLNTDYVKTILMEFAKTYGAALPSVFVFTCVKFNATAKAPLNISDIFVLSSLLEKIVTAKIEPLLLACCLECDNISPERKTSLMLFLMQNHIK
jgi:hypothetical protein